MTDELFETYLQTLVSLEEPAFLHVKIVIW